MQFATVRLISDHVEVVARFYADVMGSAAVGSADYTEIGGEKGTGTIAIVSRAGMTGAGQPVPESLVNSSVILEFVVDDVDVVRTRIDRFRDAVVQEPTDQAWGNRSMLIRDPDGTLVNVYSPLPGAQRDWPSQQS